MQVKQYLKVPSAPGRLDLGGKRMGVLSAEL